MTITNAVLFFKFSSLLFFFFPTLDFPIRSLLLLFLAQVFLHPPDDVPGEPAVAPHVGLHAGLGQGDELGRPLAQRVTGLWGQNIPTGHLNLRA